MKLTPDTYIPSLRWRMGEYQGLTRLTDAAKDRVVPFIVIPEIEFDFEEWKLAKTLDEHVTPFSKSFRTKWGVRPAWIDVHPKIIAQPMSNGKLPITFVFDELAKQKHEAVPITSLDVKANVNAAVAAIVMRDGKGVGIRARLAHVMKTDFASSLNALIAKVGIAADEVDLIIDLGAPHYEPYEDFANALLSALSSIQPEQFRSYVLMGCAYPETMAMPKPGGSIKRHDWLFYQVFVDKLAEGSRIPNFADYAIVNPEFTPKDMRKIKSGGKVVYTANGSWLIRKGGAFRDNPKQMHDHCEYIVKQSGKFRGAAFSVGDDYIEKCANKKVGPSNQTFWKQVAVNHHIMHVLEDLSNFV